MTFWRVITGENWAEVRRLHPAENIPLEELCRFLGQATDVYPFSWGHGTLPAARQSEYRREFCEQKRHGQNPVDLALRRVQRFAGCLCAKAGSSPGVGYECAC